MEGRSGSQTQDLLAVMALKVQRLSDRSRGLKDVGRYDLLLHEDCREREERLNLEVAALKKKVQGLQRAAAEKDREVARARADREEVLVQLQQSLLVVEEVDAKLAAEESAKDKLAEAVSEKDMWEKVAEEWKQRFAEMEEKYKKTSKEKQESVGFIQNYKAQLRQQDTKIKSLENELQGWKNKRETPPKEDVHPEKKMSGSFIEGSVKLDEWSSTDFMKDGKQGGDETPGWGDYKLPRYESSAQVHQKSAPKSSRPLPKGAGVSSLQIPPQKSLVRQSISNSANFNDKDPPHAPQDSSSYINQSGLELNSPIPNNSTQSSSDPQVYNKSFEVQGMQKAVMETPKEAAMKFKAAGMMRSNTHKTLSQKNANWDHLVERLKPLDNSQFSARESVTSGSKLQEPTTPINRVSQRRYSQILKTSKRAVDEEEDEEQVGVEARDESFDSNRGQQHKSVKGRGTQEQKIGHQLPGVVRIGQPNFYSYHGQEASNDDSMDSALIFNGNVLDGQAIPRKTVKKAPEGLDLLSKSFRDPTQKEKKVQDLHETKASKGTKIPSLALPALGLASKGLSKDKGFGRSVLSRKDNILQSSMIDMRIRRRDTPEDDTDRHRDHRSVSHEKSVDD